MLSGFKTVRPFIPMLIADSFTPAALNECRSRGVIATRPETVFGQDVARALEDLLQVLTNVASADSERIERIFKKLSSIEGAAGNLRGALFELIVGYCVKELEGGQVDVGRVVRNSETFKSAEIDVLCHKQRTVNIYECKGHQPTVKVRRKEIDRWLHVSIPTIYSTLKQDQQFSGSSFTFEFWTTASFDEESLDLLEEAKAGTLKYAIDWKSGKGVRAYAQGLSTPGIRKILDDHYFNHPMTKKTPALEAKTSEMPKAELQEMTQLSYAEHL